MLSLVAFDCQSFPVPAVSVVLQLANARRKFLEPVLSPGMRIPKLKSLRLLCSVANMAPEFPRYDRTRC
jgi:hypothetical protein